MDPNPWINFVLYAVSGETDKADRILSDYTGDVYFVASILKQSLKIRPSPIFRGLVLDEDEIDSDGNLYSHENMGFISWSRSIDVASEFADPSNVLACTLRHRKKDPKAYLSSSTTENYFVLFDSEWFQGLATQGINLEVAAHIHPEVVEGAFSYCLRTQQEVITSQPEKILCHRMDMGHTS